MDKGLPPEGVQLLRGIIEGAWTLAELAGDEQTQWWLHLIADSMKPARARRRKRVHNPRLNATWRIVYEAAPLGKKRAALAGALARNGRVPTAAAIASAIRQVRRMQRRPMTVEEVRAVQLSDLPPEG